LLHLVLKETIMKLFTIISLFLVTGLLMASNTENHLPTNSQETSCETNRKRMPVKKTNIAQFDALMEEQRLAVSFYPYQNTLSFIDHSSIIIGMQQLKQIFSPGAITTQGI